MATAFSWSEIFASRRDKIRGELAAHNLDALLIMLPANRFYLSGFELHDTQPGESGGFILITADGRDFLATDSRYTDAAARLWPREQIFIYSRSNPCSRLLRQNGSIIGVEAEAVSWHWLTSARTMLGSDICLLPISGIVEKFRAIKEPCEIAALEKSFALNHKLLDYIAADWTKWHGRSERDLAWEVEKFFRENGAQELAFATIAAIGPNAALPHAQPDEDRLVPNVPFLLDLGCRVDNYCSDQTRTWWIGDRPTPEFTKTLELVKSAQAAALRVIRPGVACSEVFRAAREVFLQAGVADAFTHGLGHGVGLQTHELPTLNASSEAKLEENMVVTVEPGLYYPAWGGIRWEHTVIVEKNGPRIL